MREPPTYPGRQWQRFWPSTGCAPPSSELGIDERWYPATALDDLLGFPAGTSNDARLYPCLNPSADRLPHKTKLERRLKERYGELFGTEFDVLLYDLTAAMWKARPRRIR